MAAAADNKPIKTDHAMSRILLGLVLPIVGTAMCMAATVNITTPMDFFWIRHGPIASYDNKHLYGPSDPSATWFTNQWGTNPPATEMLPFQAIPCQAGQTKCFRAVSSEQIVTQYTAGGTVFALLQSQGVNQPCVTTGNGGNPYEHDTFISPINNAAANYPGYPAGIVNQPALGGATPLTALTFSATIRFKWLGMNVLARCPVSGTAATQMFQAILSATFSNPTAGQTLFWQITLNQAGFVNTSNPPAFFNSSGPTYGYNDDISSYAPTFPGATASNTCGNCSNQVADPKFAGGLQHRYFAESEGTNFERAERCGYDPG